MLSRQAQVENKKVSFIDSSDAMLLKSSGSPFTRPLTHKECTTMSRTSPTSSTEYALGDLLAYAGNP